MAIKCWKGRTEEEQREFNQISKNKYLRSDYGKITRVASAKKSREKNKEKRKDGQVQYYHRIGKLRDKARRFTGLKGIALDLYLGLNLKVPKGHFSWKY